VIKSVNNYPISQLFDPESNVIYSIPMYQREYTWNKGQWETLFDDVYENENGYFLGSIICINQSDDALQSQQLEVVDGQQRLTTISILFAAVYGYLSSKSDLLDDDQKNLLFNLKRRLVLKNTDAQKLNPQSQNNNSKDFTSMLHECGVIKKPVEKLANAGNRRIYKAFNFFQSKLDDLFIVNNDIGEVLNYLDKLNQACLVKIEVSSHSDAYTLFESLNNRGVPLTAIDLIKNKLLAKLDVSHTEQIQSYFDQWIRVLSFLGDDYAIQERFFRQFYNAFKEELNEPFKKGDDKKRETLGSIATKSNLMGIFEKIIDRDPNAFLEDIYSASFEYSALLLNGKNESWSECQSNLRDLNNIQGVPSYLLLLYLMRKKADLNLSYENFNQIIKNLISFFVRRNLTDSPPTRDLTLLFMAIIKDIGDKKGKDLVEFIYARLKAVSSPDQLFEEKLRGPLYDENTDVARFLLCYLAERHMTSETRVNLWEQRSNKYLWTIEHIFPQGENIPKEWVDMIANGDAALAKNIQQQVVHQLGNLTISGFNSNLSNLGFEEKKNRKDSEGRFIGFKNNLKLNEYIASQDKWTKQNIDSRSADLVSQILKTFALN
jgi:uncharacterized protein with ParB-like and HNH nuclease domain